MEALLALVLVSAAADPSLAGGPEYEQPCRIQLYAETAPGPVCAERAWPVRHQPMHEPAQHRAGGHEPYEVRHEVSHQSRYEVRRSEHRHATVSTRFHDTSHQTGHPTGDSATVGTVRLNDGFFHGPLSGGVERPARTIVYAAGRRVVVIHAGGGASVSAFTRASAQASTSATGTVGGAH